MRTIMRGLLAIALVAAVPLRAQPPAECSDSAIRAIVRGQVDAKLAKGIVVGVLDQGGAHSIVIEPRTGARVGVADDRRGNTSAGAAGY